MKKATARQRRCWLSYALASFFVTIAGVTIAGVTIAGVTIADDALVNRSCEPIHLGSETRSKVVRGMILPETRHCYALSLSKGHTARLRLMTDSDIVFSVIGHVQAETDYLMAGQIKPYEVVIFQRYRSITPEYYRLRIDASRSRIPSQPTVIDNSKY